MNGLSMERTISRPMKIVIAVSLVAVLILLVYLPVSRQQNRLEHILENARGRYLEILALAQQYESITSDVGSKKSVLLQEPLFSYVEKVTRNLKLTRRIDYVRPENRTRDDGSVMEVVHVAFKGITLNEFVRFLYHIEVQKREIFIKNIAIKKDGKRDLNTQMTLQKRS